LQSHRWSPTLGPTTARSTVEELPLNAPPQEQQKLLDLQALDSTLDQLAHRRQHLPENAELTDLAAQKAQVRDRLVAATTRASDIKREQDKLEADIDQVRQRMGRDQQRLDAGTVSSAKELESLQHEIESLHRRQNALEDVELEVMEQLEEVDTEVTQLQAEQVRLDEATADAERRRDTALTDIARDEAFARQQRDLVVVDIGAELLGLYDKLRAQYGGIGAVPIKHRRCEGCRLEMTPTDLARLRGAAEDAVLRCEECRRIQVRTAESGL
jgi:predicted  nucleic acid-binding Zn-ribbon protein